MSIAYIGQPHDSFSRSSFRRSSQCSLSANCFFLLGLATISQTVRSPFLLLIRSHSACLRPMIFLPNSLGIEGVAVARLIGIVVALPVFILVEAKLLKGLDVWFWFSTIWRLFVASLIMWIAQIFCISVISTGWLSLISASLLGTAVFGSVIYLLDFFSDEERNILKSFLNRK